jgi:hypothetical protein
MANPLQIASVRAKVNLGSSGSVMRLGRRARSRTSTPLSKRALLQHVNRELVALAAEDAPAPVYCECGRDDCILSIDVTRAELDAARAHPASAIVWPEHRRRDEPVLERCESFLVVVDADAEAALDADRMPHGLEL